MSPVIATEDALTANRRFRGIADMDRFSSRNDLVVNDPKETSDPFGHDAIATRIGGRKS
jgi:hypothetical protein